MLCPNCHAEISDNVKFCTKCGRPIAAPVQPAAPQPQNTAPVQPAAPQSQNTAPVQPAAPQPQNTAPVQPAAPQPQNTAPVQPTAPQPQYTAPVQPAVPVQSYSEPPAKAKKKFNPLVVIIPAAVVVLAAVAVVLYFLLFSKPAVTVDDLEQALSEQDFRTALEMTEQLPKSDCEKVIEDYITDLLDADSEDIAKNEKIIQKMFSKGFDKYKKIYKNYKNGKYSPEQPEDSTSSQPADNTSSQPADVTSSQPADNTSSSASSEPAQADASSSTSSAAESSSQTEPNAETFEPTAEPVQTLPLSEQVTGHWRRKVRTNCYEDIVFLKDGTGYIYSDIVSEKRSATSSKFLYHDGKIHFEWWADDSSVYIDAEIDPYCFIAYQGYAATGHFSSATWKGSKNNSHDYYFGYDTQEEYLCDMLGIKKVSELYSNSSLTRDYWTQFLSICDNAWNKYFYHSDQFDKNKYKIDYTTLADSYYNSPELREKYEDVDLYHFVPFTKWVLIGTDNPTTISLDFDMEDFDRVD